MRIQTLVVMVMAFLLVACGASPQATVKEFYQSVEKGEISKANSLLSLRLHQMLGDAKLNTVLAKEHEKIKQRGGVKNIEIEGEPGKEVASFNVKVTYGNGLINSEKTNLVLEDGRWKITATK